MQSLNGGRKIHPLSIKAFEVLKILANKPKPCAEINPGIQDRLIREGLASWEELKSPYRKHKGGTCAHLVITDKGRERLSA